MLRKFDANGCWHYQTPSLYVCLLQVENFPSMARTSPDLSKDAVSFRDLAPGFTLVLRPVGNQRRVRSERPHRKIAERVVEKFILVRCVDLRLLVGKGSEALFEHAELIVDHRRERRLVFVLERLPQLAHLGFELRYAGFGNLLLLGRYRSCECQYQDRQPNQRSSHIRSFS